jgi:LCP family protein required for cell wall assembly
VRERGRAHSPYRRWAVRTIAAVVVVAMVSAGALGAYVWHLNSQIRRVNVDNLTGAGPSGTENILLVGSTNRCGLKTKSPVFGDCAAGVTGVNSDVVMIVHLDNGQHSVSLLSIPRDLFVPNARSTGPGKIDAALAEGPSQLVNVIEQDIGIPINHYVELNFDGFQGVVDALGGVNMYFPEPVYDANSGLDIRTSGCMSLNGFQALSVVRARHLQYQPPNVKSSNPRQWPFDPQSDLSRIRRDHEFLRVLAASVASQGLANPVTDEQLVSSLLPQLQVDQTMSLHHMADLVLAFHDLHPDAIPQYTLPVRVLNSATYLYKGTNYGAVEFTDQASDQQVIDQFLGTDATTDTMTGNPLPDPHTVNVTVHNGTGRGQLATTIANGLKALGFNASPASDTPATGTISETIVTYNSPDTRAAAQAVAHTIDGAVVLDQDPTATPSTVIVTVGTIATTVAAATTAPTTQTPTTTAKPSALPPPTPATSDLTEFDPRSCTTDANPGV